MDDYALKGNFPTQSPTQQPTPKPTMRPTREQKAPYERMLEGLKPLAKYAKKPEVIAGGVVLAGAAYYRQIRNRNVAEVIEEQTGNPMGDVEMREL